MNIETVCLDASVIIAVLQEEAGRVQDSVAVLRAIRDGDLKAVCPTLVVTEVQQPPVWQSGPFSLEDYLRSARISLRALDVVVAQHLKTVEPRSIRGKFFRDQVYLATALASRATHLFTWDDQHINRVKNNSSGIVVCRPQPPNNQLSLL